MPKRKHRDEAEFYKGQLREKDKEIRALQRRIKTLEKQEHIYNGVVEDLIDAINEENKVNNKCKMCSDGILEVLDLKHVIYETCNSCGYKKKKS